MCSTPRVFSILGNIMSTLGDIMSTLGDIMSTLGDTMMSVEDIMSTAGVFSTLGDTMMSAGGYHGYTGGDVPYTGVSIRFPNHLPPHLS